MFDHVATELEILANAVVAAILGGALGWEREMAGKPAGARTLALVCLSSALLMMLGSELATEFQAELGGSGTVTTDPARVLQGIIAGIAFIGAGVIFSTGRNHTVEGVTTAATILATTAIGVAVSLHFYILSVGVTLLTLIILTWVRALEARSGLKRRHSKEP